MGANLEFQLRATANQRRTMIIIRSESCGPIESKTVTGPPPNWPYSSQASETYEYDRALGANGITEPQWRGRRQDVAW